MILKKLEIQGFKSFAERTEVLFSSGVIAVVGPNGSGKSNISDAILWVLGEQNVRALRGQKSQDVIFSGTDKRRPVGMAEVSLTVDNTSGRLPIDYSEVTVTRRAYRSGESEFFINKTPCRLKDIYELFLDTGVGREAYSIVSQGEMDAILSAKPEDRRALFDEAAGIKKYRHKKKEAEKKLETTEQNIYRVNDIVHEIETEIDPMREQAEVAERYLELAERLQEIEVGILTLDLHRFTEDIKKVREEKDTSSTAIADSDALLSALEEEKSALSVDLANADAQMERFQSIHQEALTHVERTESQLALVDQRNSAAENTEKLLVEEITQLEGRIAQLELQLTGISGERGQVEKEEEELNVRLAQRTSELRNLQDKLDTCNNSIEDHKANYIEMAKSLAAQRNELGNTSGKIESLQALLERRSIDLREAEKESNQAASEYEKAGEELENVRVELSSVSKSMAELREKVEAKKSIAHKATEESILLSREIVDKQSRLKTLKEMEESKEGYFLGVRSVAAGSKSGAIRGNYAVFADVIRVPKGYENAYEVALGSSLQDIITDSEHEAKSAIEYLKKNRAGRATFLPLNMMRHSASPMLKELVGKNGVLGLGNELVNFEKKYTPAIDALLAKTLIADSIESAITASKSAIGWSKIVTLEGEIVYPSGAMTGGHAANKTTNILGRKQEIKELEADVNKLQERYAKVQKELTAVEEELSSLSAELVSLEDKDTALKMSLLEKERQLEYAEREARRLKRDFEALQAEKEELQGNLLKNREAHAQLVAKVESADRENVDLDNVLEEVEQQIRELQSEYDSVSADISAINVALASITQKKLGMEQSLDSSKSASKEIATEIYRKREQLENAQEEMSNTEQKRIELGEQLEKAHKSCEETRVQADQWRKTKQTILNSSMEVNERIKEAVRNRDELTQKLHSVDLREARLDMQISQITVRLLDEYDISPEEALRRNIPEEKQGSSAEVIRLRREMRSMGDVNTGAVQEYARLAERYEFLSNQRRDLVDARQKLLDAIREIDESTHDIFMDTFRAVDSAFSNMFNRLFGGGKTELILTDPENIMETGIDVMVELPGKKRQSLHLLSGGERALTASALMFALMIVRPSPFCVLDEVDAPLDELNVQKYADVIKDFAENSQMIVITHNKATMEAADILYGVTMQEPGVSKLVSVKLSDVVEKN